MNAKEFFYEFGRSLYKIDTFYAEFAKKKHVKSTILWVLYALNDGKEHTQKEICDTWELPRTTANTVVKELEADGMVTLSQIKGKKREMLVSLTEAGKQYAEDTLSDLYALESHTFEALNQDARRVIEHLDQILLLLNQQEK